MCKLLYFLFSICLTVTIRLNIPNRINLKSSYNLKCENFHGNVTYNADNLPSGGKLNQDKLEIYDSSLLKEGYFVVRIRAEDSYGSTDEQIIVLVIQKQIRRES